MQPRARAAAMRGGGVSTIDFRISSARLVGGAHVVALGGEVDLHTAPQLGEELDAVAADAGRRVIVDLSGATFIDSTVLGVLLRALRRTRRDGGQLVLVSDDRRILRTFEITGLDRKFRIEATLTEAVENLVHGGAR